MSKLSIIAFNRKSVGFPNRNFVSAKMIPKQRIGFKTIAIIQSGFGSLIYQALNTFQLGIIGHYLTHFHPPIVHCRLWLYRKMYSDFWEAYANVFPKETHDCVGKESGQTNHVKR